MPIVSAKTKQLATRISQCDIFHDIDIVERIEEGTDGIVVHYLHLPLVIVLNQDCDLNSDNRDKQKDTSNKDCRLLHLIVAPLFNFDEFKQGKHWDGIFDIGDQYNPLKTTGKKVMNNEDPRYHYLQFEEGFSTLPNLVIDFKHFFTVSTDYLYDNIDNRVCTLGDLYREKVSQRFAYFISRIGLPE